MKLKSIIALGLLCSFCSCSERQKLDPFHLLAAARSSEQSLDQAKQAESSLKQIIVHRTEIQQVLLGLRTSTDLAEKRLAECERIAKERGVLIPPQKESLGH